MKLLWKNVSTLSRIYKMQKLVSSSQCLMCSTFSTSSSDHHSEILQKEKSIENEKSSSGNIHEILHEFTKFYSHQKLVILKSPETTTERLHELLKTSSNENSKSADKNPFENYIDIFHTAAAINFKRSHLLHFEHVQFKWVINLGDLTEENALKQLAQKLPKSQHNMIPIILSIPLIPKHSLKFKQTIIKMVDYCLCFKRNLDYQQSLAHAYALFKAWRQLNPKINLKTPEEITESWSNFANFPSKTCDDILTDWPTVRQLNSSEFLISLFLCGLNQRFPGSVDPAGDDKFVPVLIKRKLIYCCPSWSADEMSFLALTLKQIQQALEPSDTKAPHMFLVKIFSDFLQSLKPEAMLVSPLSTLESLCIGLDLSINDCTMVLKTSPLKTILKIYEPYHQELSIDTLVTLLRMNKVKDQMRELDVLVDSIESRLNDITDLHLLLSLVQHLFDIGYWKETDKSILRKLQAKTDQLDNVAIEEEFRLIHLTCKLSRCGVFPRKMVEYLVHKVNTFQPFIEAQNKHEMLTAATNFESFGEQMYLQRSVHALLDLDYTLEMDYPDEGLRICPKIRLKLDLLQEAFGVPNRVSEAMDLAHQHFSTQLGEDKVYCGPVLPYNRHNVNLKNIVLCLKNGSLNQALDIPNEYRSSLDSPFFVKPPTVKDGYTWKCILIPPFSLKSGRPLAGYELYRIKHLKQLGYEVVIFDRSDINRWQENAVACMSRSRNILLKCLDELQIK